MNVLKSKYVLVFKRDFLGFWTFLGFSDLDIASKFVLFSVSGLKDEKVTKKQTNVKTETCKLYSRVFWILLPNVIEIDPYNFELYQFRVCAFFWDTLLTIPRTKTEFARRSYSYSASFVWNSLPSDVLYCNSEPTFKKHLKTFLFNSCFYASWLTPPSVPL